MKKKVKLAIEISCGLLIIGFLISKIDVGQTIEILKKVNLSWFAIAIFIHIILFLLTSYSLKVFFDTKKHIAFKEWLKFYLIGYSMGLILPGRTGDLSIIYFTKEQGFEIGESTAFTIIDKIITIAIFGLISAIGIFTFLQNTELYIGLIATIITLVAAIFLFTTHGRKYAIKILGKHKEYFQGFYKAYKNLATYHKKAIAINIAITVIRPFGNALFMLVLFKSLGLTAPFFYLVLINAITLIASLIPITPNGLGIREGIGSYLLTQVGIPLEIGISMYLLTIIILYTTGIIGILHYFLKKKTT